VLDLLAERFELPRLDSVKALLDVPYKGRAPTSTSSRFCCLILSGAQGRAIVRSMHTGAVTELERRMVRYFQSIDIASEQPLPLGLMMRGLVLQGKLENLPPALVTDVFLAIVFGRLFPQT